MPNPDLWYKEAVFYELNVRAFHDSNGDGIGDLPGVTARLDYLQSLGVDVIWLLPITPSPLRDDGYDVSDHYNIHPMYGCLEDFRSLVSEAHRRGLKVVVELVPNHTSDQHAWFQASRDPVHPEHARYRDYYVWSETDERYKDARIIFIDSEKSNWSYDPLRKAYYWHRFFYHQPDLNYDNPDVQRAMLRVVQFWIDQGADGIRVDAPPYLFEREGTNCENLPETHAFLKRLRTFVEAYAPGTMLLSEANQWPEDVRPYFGEGDEMHMNFHFPLMPRIFMALAKADRSSIVDILARTPALPEACQWGIFLRCHDELTLEMVTPDERRFMWDFYAPEPRMRLNLGIRRRLAPLLDNDRRKIELANSLLLSLPGSPFIYYGDEIGMGDNIWLKDRDGVRTPMQWNAQPGAGFSEAPAETWYAPMNDQPPYAAAQVNVAAQQADPTSLFNKMRSMIRVRKEQQAFSRGKFNWAETGNQAVAAYWRIHREQTVLVLNNLSNQAQAVAVQLPVGATECRDLFSGAPVQAVAESRLQLNLSAYQFHWLSLSTGNKMP
ncbi:MAG: maltose alpha-D-glucosyltransferase [Anaerolineales bacterium]|nr:maltose alpha-D-glucosyltransferase [Anaerolineales bacterium]